MPHLQKKITESNIPRQPEVMQESQQNFSVIRDQELQKAGFEEALRQNQELQDSKRKVLGVTYQDSLEMNKVKSSEAVLLRFFSSQKLAPEPDVFQAQLDTARFLYQQLIQNCQAYESSHKRPWSASGKARKRMVQQIRKIAEHEIGKLEPTAKVLQQRNPENSSWADVLGSLRVANIDLDAHETESTGGATSDVTVIKYPNTRLFYKKQEQLNPLEDDVTALIQQKPEWKRNQKALAKIRELVQSEDPLNLVRIALGSYKEWDSFSRMITSMANVTFTKEEETQLKEIMPAFSPVFKKLYTRYAVAREAGISHGQDLSRRNVATSRMASLLGISGLVTDSASVTLSSRQKEPEQGIVTVMAKGCHFSDIHDGSCPVSASPQVIRDLLNLQLLDTICGQLDRNVSNLFFTYEERDGKRILTGVTGIDSDMSFGLTNYKDLEQNADGVLQLKAIEHNGTCLLPHLDPALCSNILALTRETVFFVLQDLLGEPELNALWGRIEGVQKLLEKNQDRMLDGEWPTPTIKELRNEYYTTYTSKISAHLK